MYGEYDSGRHHHSSSHDEDSGNFPNSYPYQGVKQKRVSRLGKGGSRFKCADYKTHSLRDSNDLQELTNEDSNSISKSGCGILNLFQETPQKNTSMSPPNVFRSLNTIDRSCGMYSEKPSVNDCVGNNVSSGIPFSDKKLEKPSNTLVAPECKRSLYFKNIEQKVNVLQDVVNLDNIRKTPGTKAGAPNHRSDKDHKITDSTNEKENFISQLFGTPKFGNFFNTTNEHRFSQNVCSRKIVETTHKFNKIFSPDILDPFNRDRSNIAHGHTTDDKFPGFLGNERKNSVEVEPHSLNQVSKNICGEPLNLQVRVRSNVIDGDLDNAFSDNFRPFTEDGRNNHLPSNTIDFKDSSIKMEYGNAKESYPAIPTNMENSHNFRVNANASSFFNHGKTLHGEQILPLKNHNDPFSYDKPYEQNMMNHCEAKNSYSSSSFDNKNDSVIISEKPKHEIDPSSMDNKKVIDSMNENISDKIKPVAVVSNLNIPKEINRCETDRKDHPPVLSSATQNDELKPTISYASAVSSKPIASNIQSDPQLKPPMAPPTTSNVMKPPQGITKPKSALLRTKSSSLPGRNNVLSRIKSSSTYLADGSSQRSVTKEKIYVNNIPYDVLSTLGKGGSSEVFLVFEPKNSRLLAVKCVDLSQVEDIIAEGYLNEVKLLLKLQGCDSVIKMFDHEYVEDEKSLYVVMEKGDTDLSRLLRVISKTKNISMTMIIFYWTEMLYAVKDIHDKGIIHSDLKPANFLIVCGRLKLIDFGIASSLQGDMTSVQKEVTTGTWNYMSPEAIKNNGTTVHGHKISYKSDVWSLGCILYNLVYGKTPFSHITNTWNKLNAIADSSHVIKFPEEMPELGKIPQVILKTLKNCLTRDPKLRPSVSDLLNYEYFYSSSSSLGNLDSAIDKIKDEVAGQIKNKIPLELWGKVAQVLSQDYKENIVSLVKGQIAERIKSVLPSDYWEKILPVFHEGCV